MGLLLALLPAAAAALGLRAVMGLAGAARMRVLIGLALSAGAPGATAGDEEPLNRPFAERVLRPALGAVGGLAARLLPARLMASTAAQLQRAGLRTGRPADWVGARALCALGLATYTVILFHRYGFVIPADACCLALGWALPGLYLRSRADRRRNLVRDDLPDAIDLLTVCVEAGLGFDQALLRVVERFPGPVAEEFGRVLRDQRLGTPRRAALLALLDRVELPELRAFVHAILQAEELGVRIGPVLRVQSDTLREQRRERAEEMAMKAPIKMAFPMILLILPALFLVILGPAVVEALRTVLAAHP